MVTSSHSRQRLYAALLSLGASILLFRAVVMVAGGSLTLLVPWVAALLLVELVLDAATLAGSLWWLRTGREAGARLPLRTAAAAAIVHAMRVWIFVIGRTGPWLDFDVRLEHRALHAERWSWFGVGFAAVMSILGLIGVWIIWRIRRRRAPTA